MQMLRSRPYNYYYSSHALSDPDEVAEPTRDLLAMARDGLRQRLRAAVHEATEKHNSVTVSARVRHREVVRVVSVTVTPLATTQASAGLLLVSFAPESEPRATVHVVPPASDREETENAASQRTLEEELKSTRAELQSAIEQMESTNDCRLDGRHRSAPASRCRSFLFVRSPEQRIVAKIALIDDPHGDR